jgi:hypothetical protein
MTEVSRRKAHGAGLKAKENRISKPKNQVSGFQVSEAKPYNFEIRNSQSEIRNPWMLPAVCCKLVSAPMEEPLREKPEDTV